MSTILLPRRYYSQPQGAVEIDWGHPLARGLEIIYHPSARGVLIARESSQYLPSETAGASIQTGYDRYQHGVFVGGTYLRLNNIQTALPTLQSAAAGFTASFIALARMGSSSNSTLISLARTDSDTLLFRYALLSDRTSRLQTRGTGSSPVPALANVDSPVVWTAGLYRFAVAVSPGVNTTGSVYIDGALSASGTVTDATSTGPTLLTIGALERTSVSQQFDGGMALAGVYSRALSADEAKALSENPWQLFKARPQRIYFDLGGGATNDIAATGTITTTGTAALSATGSLAATGALAWTPTADLTSAVDEDISATGSVAWTGSAALDATGTLAVAGTVLWTDTATLSAVGALDAAGALVWTNAASVSGVGALTASASITWTPAADLSATGSLAAAGAIAWTGAADLQSPTTNDIAATGSVSWTASADLSAIGNLSAAATVTVTAAADLTATGTLAGTGTIAWTGTAALQQGAAITATGAMAFTGTATLAEVSGLIARGDILISGAALLKATGALAASASLSWSGTAALTDVAVEIARYPRFSLDRINRVTLDRNTQITLRR